MIQSTSGCFLVAISLFQFLSGVISFAPPHPGTRIDPENDPVLQYRRRMDEDHSDCDLDHPENCDFLDFTFRTEARDNQVLSQASDVFRVLVIPMYFTNHRDKPRPSKQDIEELWNGVGTNDLNIPGGSIANWTSLNSYGRVTIEAEVVDWMETTGSETYFAGGRSGVPSNDDTEVQMEDAVIPLLDKLDQSNFDFSRFDQDDNFRVDATVVLHSGYAAENADVDCNGVARLDRIQSYARAFRPGLWTSSKGYDLGPIVFASAYTGFCNANIARIGTIVHEFIHTLGLPDLYDTSGKYPEGSGSVGGLGGYDIMANPNGPRSRQAFPGSLSPWSKMQLGWLEPIEITADGVYTLQPSNLEPSVYMISSPYPWGEYLLIENRQPVLFDERLWTPGGVLIYKVDETISGNGNYYRGYPGQDGWPQNGLHYRVALLQRDGLYELEKSESNGHIDDFWTEGTELGPGNGEAVASNSGIYPNTDSYIRGEIKTTGLIIRNFQETSAGVWSFEVAGLKPQQVEGTPAPVEPVTPSPVSPPTAAPTLKRSPISTTKPTTLSTTNSSAAPSVFPTIQGQTSMPTNSSSPTEAPSETPQPSGAASTTPSLRPTGQESMSPTGLPSPSPSPEPTAKQTANPGKSPSAASPVISAASTRVTGSSVIYSQSSGLALALSMSLWMLQ